ncbi:cysteine hydrolase [Rubrivivax gelatinosus]|nr:cysteine hydrolase [Rubrivivax gelatinosus]
MAATGARPPAAGDTALLLVDVINPLDFDGAQQLAPAALAAGERIAALKAALVHAGVPVVYANDNFGHWRSDIRRLLTHCRRGGGAAATLARDLAPGPRDHTVLKPRYSAFDQTPLELVLGRIGARRLIIAGFATDLCVQFSAMDAFVRGYELWVPGDCSAAESRTRHRAALAWMARALKCHTRPAWL